MHGHVKAIWTEVLFDEIYVGLVPTVACLTSSLGSQTCVLKHDPGELSSSSHFLISIVLNVSMVSMSLYSILLTAPVSAPHCAIFEVRWPVQAEVQDDHGPGSRLCTFACRTKPKEKEYRGGTGCSVTDASSRPGALSIGWG